MMRFSTLVKHPADWMIGADEGNAIVVTSRIRLARNLSGHVFPGWATKSQRAVTLQEVVPQLEGLAAMKNAFSKELSALTNLEKQVLVERHLVSREQAARGEGCAAVIDRKQSLSVMVNEEDHLRIQSICAGLHLEEAYAHIREIDQELERSLDYSFHQKYGYLTACPTNVGTGMRASAMLHLPALAISGQLKTVGQAMQELGFAIRGIYGEGTDSLGHLCQISNQKTLGESEEAIIQRLQRVISDLAKSEHHARLKLVEESGDGLMDLVGKAYGKLRFSHVYTSMQAFEDLSVLRLGADLTLLPRESMSLFDTLMMEIQPAHLQMWAKRELLPEERDVVRAKILRERLQTLEAPVSVVDGELIERVRACLSDEGAAYQQNNLPIDE